MGYGIWGSLGGYTFTMDTRVPVLYCCTRTDLIIVPSLIKVMLYLRFRFVLCRQIYRSRTLGTTVDIWC